MVPVFGISWNFFALVLPATIVSHTLSLSDSISPKQNGITRMMYCRLVSGPGTGNVVRSEKIDYLFAHT